MSGLCPNIVFLALALACGPAPADTWTQFRGPNGSGVAVDCDPPANPGPDNLAWKTPVPSGLSSPVLFGDRIFLTALDDKRLVTLAIDKTSGNILWRREAPDVPLEKVHQANNPSASTPHVDAKRIYVYFGSYGLLCYDHEGTELWKRPIPTPKSLYGMSTSPIGHDDKLILLLDNEDNLPDSKLSRSALLAVEKATGKTAWETPRPLQRSSWSTPAIWNHTNGRDLVVLGGRRAAGYDPDSGAEKWFATGFSKEAIAVPVLGGGHVYLSSAQLGGGADDKVDPAPFWDAMMRLDKNNSGTLEQGELTEHFTFPLRPELPLDHPGFGIPLPNDPAKRKERQIGFFGRIDKDKNGVWTKEEFDAHLTSSRGRPLMLAIRPGGSGDVAESHVAWELNRSIPEIPSPIFYDHRLYMVRNGGTLAAVDPANGKLLYRGRLGSIGQYSASPVAANRHLYLVSDEGTVSVVKAGSEFELVHQLELGEPAPVTPAIDTSTIYFRTGKHLWAFRNQD